MNYLDCQSFKKQLVISKERNQCTEQLGKYLLQIVERIASKPNFRGYTNIDLWKTDAIIRIIKKLSLIDTSKSGVQLFNYISSIIFNVFLRGIDNDKRYARKINHYRQEIFDIYQEEE